MDASKIKQDLAQEGEKVHGFFKHVGQKTDNIRKEFVEFINRGSVIDLAIGVAVGGAFNAIVNSFVNDIVTPIVGLLAGGVNFDNLAIHIHNFFGMNDEATISYGKFIQSVLQFLIVAWVFFLIVKAMNGLHRRHDADMAKLEKLEENLGKKEAQLSAKVKNQKAEKKSSDKADDKASKKSK